MTQTALVLAGHGSHISPQTAGIVWRHVDSLRALGVADEVTAAFWKESPSLHGVFDTLAADEITVVPLFTAQGYFTQTVIPAEMGLSGPITRRDGRTIRYARTLNDHPYLSRIVQQRIRDTMAAYDLSASRTAVAIVGHSTRRNAKSRKASEAQADQIREMGIAAEVVAVYLDDLPRIADVYTLTSAPTLIAVPYFLALGSHTTLDVPAALMLPQGQTSGKVGGRTVYYTDPVGIDDTLREVILELARDAGAPLYLSHPGSPWEGFPAAGRDELIAAVNVGEITRFGQLSVSLSDICPLASSGETQAITDPGSLRQWVRESAGFRPLATTTDMPEGWHVPISDPAMIAAVIETVYPGALADWAAYHSSGDFATETLDSLAARQTGMYRTLNQLPADRRAALVDHVCGRCVRNPTWYRCEAETMIPCKEPCNVWMTEALQTLETAGPSR